MKLAFLIAKYGYGAILVGAFLEGETIVLLAGILAKRGVLELWGVILVAFLGSFAGDQLAYFVGHFYGAALLRRNPKWQPRVDRIHAMFAERGTWLLVGFRFLYGLRNLVPFTVGLGAVPPRRFFPWNLLGAAIWAPAIAGAGYEFGSVVGHVLHRARSYEVAAFGVGAAALAAFLLVQRLRKKRSNGGTRDPSGGN